MMEWNIQARAHGCQACNQSFEDKQAFHTLLFDAAEGYERLDVCPKCWEGQFSQGATGRKGFISHWQSVYMGPLAQPPEAIQKDSAEGLLRKLMDNNDPAHAGARFILAVMLERKRILKVKAQLHQGDQRVFVYEHPKTGELFNIPDPNLQLNQLEAVQRDIVGLLEYGLEGKPPAAEQAPTPEPSGEAAAAPA